MDYMSFVAYAISVISLALSLYTLYELNCTKDKTPQKPKASIKPVAKTSSTKQYPHAKWK